MPPTSVNDKLWPPYWREELTRPSRYEIYDREVPSDQNRLQGVLRGTRRLDNVVEGPSGSTTGAWMCQCACGNRERRNEGKPRRSRGRQRRLGPITQSATNLGFIGHLMQGNRVRYRECKRVSQRGMGQARAALVGQRTLGAPTSHH